MDSYGGKEDARGSASGLRQGSALHPRRVFDPLDTLLAIELSASAYSVRVFIQRTYGSKKKQNPKSMKVATEGFQRATANFVCFHALWCAHRRIPLLQTYTINKKVSTKNAPA